MARAIQPDSSLSPGLGSPYSWLRTPLSEEGGVQLIILLEDCANHVAARCLQNANTRLEHISHLASPNGTPIQRIAAYFIEALADRMLKNFTGLHNALNSTKIPSVSEEILVQRLFFEHCPFLKLAYVITNQAIVEAMEGEKVIHIIDLYPVEPDQWIDLLQTLSARPEGAPHLKITGIHEQKVVLEKMALQLKEEADKLSIPFQFNCIVSKLENLDIESLGIKTGEALAVSSVLQLHSLLATDEEVLRRSQRPLREFLDTGLNPLYIANLDSSSISSQLSQISSPKMERFLSSLRRFSPKLMVITEQEANHNGCTLMERVNNAMKFYAALFDCLDSTVSIAPIERQKVEKMLFGEEIKNIIACEGAERKERHEKLEKWILWLELAGFGRVPLSYYGRLQAGRLLQSYGYGYNIKEENGCLVIYWHKIPLFSVSAWRFR
uniref:Uncharacterized protein n=1 Tax=Fagus sylvatica TaxID=28930 RepID=A0A2N9EBR2_FAGSY